MVRMHNTINILGEWLKTENETQCQTAIFSNDSNTAMEKDHTIFPSPQWNKQTHQHQPNTWSQLSLISSCINSTFSFFPLDSNFTFFF
ncbi:hypothetical protein RIF29_33736 [Crotalaria pallida]|uniref:Uncharacterized protein n=1 Tax=Crotalaria pallida TaxID=3830 RepID=A0AAN9HT53_CROPI